VPYIGKKADLSVNEPNNIIDLMPYIEGQKFGWTVDMTHAVLQHGKAETNQCLTHAREAYRAEQIAKQLT
jgi:hypothetical protein